MRILEKLFRSKKKNKYERDSYGQEAADTRYANLDEEPVNQEFRRPTEREDTGKQYVVDLCEQMIDVSRELEDAREEYNLVTNYLNDIQTIEEMTPAEKAPIVECANHVAQLEQSRAQYLETERRLSETQYAQMEAEDEELPGVIKRLKANETYLDAIRKDLSYLGGEKLEWEMQKSESMRRQRLLRKAAFYLLAVYGTMVALLLILALVAEQNTQIPMMIVTALAAVLGVIVLVRYQDCSRDMEQADLNRNRAITLENHVKIKYVNIKNAVDYTCEKYHTRGAKDLAELYERYQEEVREKEKFRQTNDDLDHYSKELVLHLQDRHLYDSKIWLSHANALIDSREMVELKHDLITRRQKLRSQIEYNLNTLADMKKEIMQNLDRFDDNGLQVQQIIRKLEEISESLL